MYISIFFQPMTRTCQSKWYIISRTVLHWEPNNKKLLIWIYGFFCYSLLLLMTHTQGVKDTGPHCCEISAQEWYTMKNKLQTNIFSQLKVRCSYFIQKHTLCVPISEIIYDEFQTDEYRLLAPLARFIFMLRICDHIIRLTLRQHDQLQGPRTVLMKDCQ